MKKFILTLIILLFTGTSIYADNIPGKYWDMYKKPPRNGQFELSVYLDSGISFPNSFNVPLFPLGPGINVKGTWNIKNFKLGFQVTGHGFGPELNSTTSDYFVHTSLSFIFGYRFHIYGLLSISPYIGVGASLYFPGDSLSGFSYFGPVNIQPYGRIAVDFNFGVTSFIDIVFSMASSITAEAIVHDTASGDPRVLGMGHFGLGVILKF